MSYLIDHFLAPHAYAAHTGFDSFAEFTFDHALNGIIAAGHARLGQTLLVQPGRGTAIRRARQPGVLDELGEFGPGQLADP
jgi:hypothetical protein